MTTWSLSTGLIAALPAWLAATYVAGDGLADRLYHYLTRKES